MALQKAVTGETGKGQGSAINTGLGGWHPHPYFGTLPHKQTQNSFLSNQAVPWSDQASQAPHQGVGDRGGASGNRALQEGLGCKRQREEQAPS